MYADLKKEKQKSEDNFKKDTESLKKQKAVLESELLTAGKVTKNKDEERMVILRIFDGMQEVMSKINNLTTSQNNTVKEYQCGVCNYKSNDNDDLKKHRQTQHEEVVIYNYSCNICDKKFLDLDSLNEHKRCHVKKLKCKDCLFKADSKEELDEHTRRRHRVN